MRFPALARPCLLLLAIAGCGGQTQQGTPAAVTPVVVAQATLGPATPVMHVHGVLANRDEMRLAFKVGGLIRRLAVDSGDRVRRGQVLAEIDTTEIDAQLKEVRELDAKAARDLERGERLYADKVLALEPLQNLRTQRELAAARLKSTNFNRGHAVITAPADGIVLQRLAREHELVPSGQPVLVLGSVARGYVVRAAVADRELLQIHLADPARVRIDALPGREFAGAVSERSGAADPATGLFPIEVRLAPTDAPLVSGLVANLQLSPGGPGDLLVRIPAGALVEADGQRGSVFVLEDGHARRREVQIAFLDGDEIALRDGVRADELVITEGAAYLDDGERVAIAGR